MGKKSATARFQETQQLRWFQWEFLRRNREYRRDFEKLINRFGYWFKKNGFWYERHKEAPSDQDVVFSYNHIYPLLMEICRKSGTGEGDPNLPREVGKLQTSGSVRTFIEQWDVAEVPVLYVRSVNCDEIAPRGLCVEKVFKIVAAHLAQLAHGSGYC